MMDEPDYAQYSLDDLLDVQQRIDREAYPGRAAAVERELARRRSEAARGGARSEAVPAAIGAPVAVRPGRAASLAGVAMSIGLCVVGLMHLLPALEKSDWSQTTSLIFFCLVAVSGLVYNAFNLLFRRSGRRFPGNHCPYCGALAPETEHLCPTCGKDI